MHPTNGQAIHANAVVASKSVLVTIGGDEFPSDKQHWSNWLPSFWKYFSVPLEASEMSSMLQVAEIHIYIFREQT